MKGKKKKDESGSSALLDRVVEDAIKISDRFSPEPVFGPTGKGSLKSLGVRSLQKLKEKREDS